MSASAPDDASPWIVLKFGGTSVSKRSRWDRIGRLAAQRRSEGARVLLVVSAVSGVTNALQALIDAHADPDACRAAAEALDARHREFARELQVDPDVAIGDLLDQLQALSSDPRRAAAALEWQAELLALGELCSSRLGAAYLCSQGHDIVWSDARDHLRALAMPNQSAWAGRLAVNCEIRGDPAWRARYAGQGELLITQGFICRDAAGRTSILGRGGSGPEKLSASDWPEIAGGLSARRRVRPPSLRAEQSQCRLGAHCRRRGKSARGAPQPSGGPQGPASARLSECARLHIGRPRPARAEVLESQV
jgi:aspartokinase